MDLLLRLLADHGMIGEDAVTCADTFCQRLSEMGFYGQLDVFGSDAARVAAVLGGLRDA